MYVIDFNSALNFSLKQSYKGLRKLGHPRIIMLMTVVSQKNKYCEFSLKCRALFLISNMCVCVQTHVCVSVKYGV